MHRDSTAGARGMESVIVLWNECDGYFHCVKKLLFEGASLVSCIQDKWSRSNPLRFKDLPGDRAWHAAA